MPDASHRQVTAKQITDSQAQFIPYITRNGVVVIGQVFAEVDQDVFLGACDGR